MWQRQAAAEKPTSRRENNFFLNSTSCLQDIMEPNRCGQASIKKAKQVMNAAFCLYHFDFEVFKRGAFPAVEPDGNNSSTYYELLSAK